MLAAVLAAAALATAPQPAPPLVFASDRDPNLDATKLYTLTVATRKLRLLTPSGFLDTGAAWWPGGRRIVVARTTGSFSGDATSPPSHLVLVDAGSGRVLRTLTNGRGESCPAPSPNGRWLVYCEALRQLPPPGMGGNNGEIELARVDGGAARRVPGTAAMWPLDDTSIDDSAAIAWAPDSSAVAIEVYDLATEQKQDAEPRIVVVSPAGRVLHRLRGRLAAWPTRHALAVVRTTRLGSDYVALVTPSGALLRRVRGAAATELRLAALHRPGTRQRICADYTVRLALCIPGTRVRRPLTPPPADDDAQFAALAWSQDGRRLLYTDSVEVCFADVYETVPGSGAVRRLVGSPYEEDEPALAPDGGSVAYARASGGRTQSFVERLPDGPTVGLGDGRSPSWSPDGSSLALASERGLVVVSADGSERRVVADGSFGSVDWSPDGRTLVAALGSPPQLVTLPAAGGAVRALGLQGQDPAWSPDGKRIAFSSGGIWVAAADRSGAVQITRVGQNFGHNFNEDVHPTWAPDGSEIAFASGASLADAVGTGIICPGECPPDVAGPEPYVVAAVAPDGSNWHVLIEGPGADFDPRYAASRSAR